MKTKIYSSKNKMYISHGMVLFVPAFIAIIGTLVYANCHIDFWRKDYFWFRIATFSFFTLFCLSGSSELYYVTLYKDKLVIKNLIFFWVKFEYFTEKIKSIKYFYNTTQKGYEEGISIKTTNEEERYDMKPFDTLLWKNFNKNLQKVDLKLDNYPLK